MKKSYLVYKKKSPKLLFLSAYKQLLTQFSIISREISHAERVKHSLLQYIPVFWGKLSKLSMVMVFLALYALVIISDWLTRPP